MTKRERALVGAAILVGSTICGWIGPKAVDLFADSSGPRTGDVSPYPDCPPEVVPVVSEIDVNTGRSHGVTKTGNICSY